MNRCSHPESLHGWCQRTAPCTGLVCEWAAEQTQPETSDGTAITRRFENVQDWTHAEEKEDVLTSPCGRFEITRVRITLLTLRYAAWDKYPTDGDGLPALKGVADSAKAALRFFDGND